MTVRPYAAPLLVALWAVGCTLTESLDDLKGGTDAGTASGGSSGSSGGAGGQSAAGGVWGTGGSTATGGTSGTGASGGASGAGAAGGVGGSTGGSSGNGGSSPICDAGWADCNGDSIDGCEVNISNDVMHCGGCGQPCTAPPNGLPVCSSGACTFVCNAPYTSCGAGCVDLSSDANNCGSCGVQCTSSSCANGTCCTNPCGLKCCGANQKCCPISELCVCSACLCPE